MRRKLHVASIVLCLLLSTGALLAADKDSPGFWPAWRGPLGTGVSPSGDPPTEWSETKNLKWKVEMPGGGHATPVVWGDRIYVLASVSKPGDAAPQTAPAAPPPEPGQRPARVKPTTTYQFVVMALDRATGKEIWRTVTREEIPHESGHETASQASASPMTDGEHIYAFFGSRGLYCLDMNGKVKWEKDLGDMRTRAEFGEGASGALHGDMLVINWDHEGDDFIVAFDKRTGTERWRVARDEPTSWSTPLVVEDAGRPVVVVSATKKVRAYDLKTGEEVWSCGGLGANCIPTPVADSGTVFVMSGYQDPAALAIKYAGAKGDLTGTDRVAWKLDRGTSYVPSPLLYDGRLYFLDRFKASLSCHDLKTGQVHFSDARIEGLGNIYASPVGAGGRIYILDRTGVGAVIRSSEKLEVLAQNKLDDTFDASPVIAGGDLYLRGHKYLYCITKTASPPAAGSASSGSRQGRR